MRLSEWLNENSNRNYPFSDSATLRLSNGYPFPLDFFLDLFLFIPCNLIENNVVLTKIIIEEGKWLFKINDIGYFEVTETAHDFEIGGTSITGNYVLGEGKNKLVAQGEYTFDGVLSSSAYCPININCVTSIGIKENPLKLIGDINIYTENNISVTADSNGNIRFDAHALESTAPELTGMTNINGVTPDPKSGFIYIDARGILGIDNIGNNIYIRTMLSPKLRCPTPFYPEYRGEQGDPGERGDQGLPGECPYSCDCRDEESFRFDPAVVYQIQPNSITHGQDYTITVYGNNFEKNLQYAHIGENIYEVTLVNNTKATFIINIQEIGKYTVYFSGRNTTKCLDLSVV